MLQWQALAALAVMVLATIGVAVGGAEATLTVSPAAAITDDTDGFTTLERANDIAITQISGRTYAVVTAWYDHGVQIIDMTDPASPAPVAVIIDGYGGFTNLDSPHGVAIAQISGRTYAVVIAVYGVQIIDITNPASPAPVAAVSAGYGGFKAPGGEDIDITQISNRTYAVVTATNAGIVQIIDITDPASPAPAAAITDDTDGFTTLSGADGVDITQISNRTYAVVTARYDHGVQIIDMTDPASPAPVAAITDDTDGFTTLSGADGVAITQISNRTYAVVTATNAGIVQIIDITDPASPAPAAAITDDTDGFTTLSGADGVDITQISNRTYAVVTARYDHGVQIIDMTDPASPAPVAAITDDTDGFTTLSGADGVAITQISGRTYAIVTALWDDGVQIVYLGETPTSPVPPTYPSSSSTPNPSQGSPSAITDDLGEFTELEDAHSVAITQIYNRTYTVVTALQDDGVQITYLDGAPVSPTPPSYPDIQSTHSLIPIPAAAITGSHGEFPNLDRPSGITLAQISGRTYAVVIANHGVQIIDMTDPTVPDPVAAITTDMGWFSNLFGPDSVAITQISGRTYAVVTATDDDGVQIIDMTDPTAPFPVATLTDDTDGFTMLRGASDIAITQISGRTYAVVIAYDGIQIIDMTDPTAPASVTTLTYGYGKFATLGDARDIAITKISGRTYAVVAAYYSVQIIDMTDPAAPVAVITDDVGGLTTLSGIDGITITQISGRTYAIAADSWDGNIQIIDITDPASPAPAAAITDDTDGFTTLSGADGVAITQISGRTYAVVTDSWDGSVQIIDMTDPASPAPVAAITDDTDGFTMLRGASDIAITQISGRTYAVVTATDDDGVQIIDMTDPAAPAPAAALTDSVGSLTSLGGPYDVAITQISGRTYAVVTALWDDGVHIIDMTDPTSSTLVAAITDDTDGFTMLAGSRGVAITQISDRTYATVTATDDGGVQIIDMTDPASPAPVAAITDDTDGFTMLAGSSGVAIAQISDYTYVVVTARYDHGVQIIDVTNPASPAPVAAITDDTDGFTMLRGASDIAITQISGRTYAVVTALRDDGIQIIDMTDPASPAPVAAITDDTDGFTTLSGADGVAITQISGRTYAVVTAYGNIQIIDMTDPASPAPVAAITGGYSEFTTLDIPHDVAITKISDRTYAIITVGNGAHLIDMTDPTTPTPAAAIIDGLGGFETLSRASGIAITQISGHTYAVVAALGDGGVQIINIDGVPVSPAPSPYSNIQPTRSLLPVPVAATVDGVGGFTKLSGPSGIAIAQISGRTYAVVAASSDDSVQIIDMTDPALPVPAAAITDDTDGFTTLAYPTGIAITQISGRTYAVVTAQLDHGVQIIDMTDPASPAPVAAIIDGYGGFTNLDGPLGIAIAQISGRTYAVVAASSDDSVQIIDMTDPALPVPAAAITDGVGKLTRLLGLESVAIAQISGRTYAVVTVGNDVQVIDMTDPTVPVPVATITDDMYGSTTLGGADGVAIAQISGRTYAVIVISGDDHVQIIDMTDPTVPVPVATITDDMDGFTTLKGTDGVAIAQISGRTYAVIASLSDDGVQIVDMTNPALPVPVAAITDDIYRSTTLEGANGVAIAQISGKTYAVVTAGDGQGVQILQMFGE